IAPGSAFVDPRGLRNAHIRLITPWVREFRTGSDSDRVHGHDGIQRSMFTRLGVYQRSNAPLYEETARLRRIAGETPALPVID
ncbi:MAG TPA: hypothetical protein VGW36_10265, partial [Pyrinomonadaceae bacterium]|nr:hypothetical protein [Pyrinomonadaceae bacterium]